MSTFTAIQNRPTLPRDTLTSAQIGVILGLETVLQSMGMILCCPRCAQEGYAHLETQNTPKDLIWKIDCRCRERRIARSEVGTLMEPSGDLLQLAQTVLTPVLLEIRCPSSRCLLTPIEITPTADGVRASCRCATFTFRKHGTTRPTH